ncbi:MAG: sialate O-acetylesterase [bacterium]
MFIRLQTALLLGTLLLTSLAQADVKLPEILGDNMVLQAEQRDKVWGIADAGEAVTVTFAGQEKKVVADDKGAWLVQLDALPANEKPQEMTIAGKNSITLKNILIGEVWVCSGQSNMCTTINGDNIVWWDRGMIDADKVAAAANYPLIRLNHKEWQVCTPFTSRGFSSVAFSFGKALYEARKVPIGLVWRAVGGTSALQWTERAALEADLHTKGITTHSAEVYPAKLKKFDAELKAWEDKGKVGTAPRKPAMDSYGGLYQQFIAPITNFGIKGAIWYQGEADTGMIKNKECSYAQLMSTLIGNWRKSWDQGDFPFLYVQLARIGKPAGKPQPQDGWAYLRDQQTQTMKLVPNTAMAIAYDVSDGDLHPKNKGPMGERLALGARAIAYGEKIEYMGPIVAEAKRDGDKLTVTFTHGTGLYAQADKPGVVSDLYLLNTDDTFIVATATIEGDTLVVDVKDAKPGTRLCYAWQQNPQGNLYNGAKLPAAPFCVEVGK